MLYKLSIKDNFLEFNKNNRIVRSPAEFIIDESEKLFWEFQLHSKGARKFIFEPYYPEPTIPKINKTPIKEINELPFRPSKVKKGN